MAYEKEYRMRLSVIISSGISSLLVKRTERCTFSMVHGVCLKKLCSTIFVISTCTQVFHTYLVLSLHLLRLADHAYTKKENILLIIIFLDYAIKIRANYSSKKGIKNISNIFSGSLLAVTFFTHVINQAINKCESLVHTSWNAISNDLANGIPTKEFHSWCVNLLFFFCLYDKIRKCMNIDKSIKCLWLSYLKHRNW